MGQVQMTETERESFLADLHVAMFAVERADGPPLNVPIWYDYEPGGELWVLTDANSLKGRLLAAAGRFSLCVQTEAAPYSYVSVEGASTIGPADTEADLRPMARRYLGETLGDQYTDGADHGDNPIKVTMTPERWYTVDYSKMVPAD